MPRGMRIIEGQEAAMQVGFIQRCREIALAAGYAEVIVPAVWEQETFTNKAGPEVLNQMYTFKDKGERDLCLIPEVTAPLVEDFEDEARFRTQRLFYAARCYRYERPQAGRYREFTQVGLEALGDDIAQAELVDLAAAMLDVLPVIEYAPAVRRGLAYYTEDGFEYSVPTLGAQKQVCGGGRYEQGIGFAIGVDRVVLALLDAGKGL